VKKCQIDEQVEVSLMSANNLVLEPRVEGGGRSEATLVRKDLHKAGGNIQTKEVGIYAFYKGGQETYCSGSEAGAL
jgi:hypothetical protein